MNRLTPAVRRMWIARCLIAAAVLLLPLGVAGVLWGVLGALGDATGARVAQGIALGTLVGWVADLAALVALLALAHLDPTGDRPSS